MFLDYSKEPTKIISTKSKKKIFSFLNEFESNLDQKTVDSFGEEWNKFDTFNSDEIKIAGDQYFDIVDEDILSKNTKVLDLGCGSGRWTKYIANKVQIVEAIDPSSAVFSALDLNKDAENVRVTQASVSNIPFNDHSFDLIICLGVLHHIPDTQQALIDVCKKLKPNGHILLYLYYNLDNRSSFYKFIFNCSTLIRKIVSKFPRTLKKITCDFI
ncbi:MAG: class I SAM-dependent methyltransferase, partial [Flavobacteriia bacterium]